MRDFLKDAIRTYVYWIGVTWGIFYIPATALATAGTLLMLIPLWGVFLTGILLLIADPPAKWRDPIIVSVFVRLVTTALAALLLFLFVTFTREGTQVFVGDWRENLAVFGGCWLVYAAAVGIGFLLYNPNRKHQDHAT